MNYLNEVIHTIKYGDDLRILANYYNTTVENIIDNNRHIDPYNLIVGDKVRIFTNTLLYYVSRKVEVSNKAKALSDEMNTLWEQHVYYNGHVCC